MTKRIISFFLVILIGITSIITTNIFANPQAPVSSFTVDEVYYTLGQNFVTNAPILRPRITVSWTDPQNWAPGNGNEEVHAPDFYEVYINNRTLNIQRTIRVNKGTDVFNAKRLFLHDEMNLNTGSLYELSIQPQHYHYVERNGEIVRELAPHLSPPVKTYAITDLNVELVPSETEITVIWDDVALQNLNYRIVYAVGDFSNQSKDALLNNMQGEITGLRNNSPDVQQFYDPVAGRNRLRYTIDQNVFPGQVYSIIVEPTMDYFDGYLVQRNRHYPHVFICSTNIDLRVSEEGDYVRLDWNIPASFKVGQDQEEYELVEARIIEYINGQGRNVVIFDNKAANMEYYKIPKPSQEAEYQIKLKYQAVGGVNKPPIEPESRRVPFVPTELKIRPTQPYVPKPVSQRILTELRNQNSNIALKEILEQEYMLPGDIFNGNINQLLNSQRVFKYDTNNNRIQFIFAPFKRRDIKEGSSTFGQTIVDTEVYYDVYVAKDINHFDSAMKVVNRIKIEPNDTSRVIRDQNDKIIGYRLLLNQYFDPDKNQLQNIIPNQLYYIKIVAIKDWGDRDVRSEPNIVPIYFDYDGNIYSPPTIAKPPLRIRNEETTQTSVTLEWKESWWEAYFINVDGSNTWYSEAWVDNDGKVYDSPIENGQYFPIHLGQVEAEKLKQRLIELGNTEVDYFVREINLGKDPFGVSDVKYKFHKMPYNEVKTTIDNRKIMDPSYNLNSYIEELLERDRDESQPLPWKDINPEKDVNSNNVLYYKENGLVPNTQYLFLLYPYRIDLTGETLFAHYPTPIVGITDPIPSEVKPDPTVPSLFVSNYTDITADLMWRYNTDLVYEMRYGLVDDITKANPVEIILPPTNDPRYPSNGSYYEQHIKDLFPNTEYYFWIRAIQPKTDTVSAWSNAVVVTTRDIENPAPPRGIGLASLENLKPHNYNENQGEDFLTVEWLLHPDDNPENYKDAKVKKSYVYIVEMANNSRFIDPIYIELTDGNNDILPPNIEKLEKNLIKINGLIPNRRYYFRLKTRVILEGENNQMLSRESLFYSPTLALLTMPSSKEYDGNPIDAIIRLPYEYYEKIYDPVKQELTYRFRFNQNDVNGEFDHFIIEKLISELLRENAYSYNIDISEFENKPIVRRKVEIPYRLWASLREYNINLVINGKTTRISIPTNSIDSHLHALGSQLGSSPTITLSMNDQATSMGMNSSLPTLALPVVIPQNISMALTTQRGTRTITTVDKPITFHFNTANRYSVYNKPVEVVRWNQSSQKWDKAVATYNNTRRELDLKTNNLGLYYSYVTNGPAAVQSVHWAIPFKQNVENHINITGNVQDLNRSVKKSEYANILYALLEGNKSVDINQSINSTKLQNLKSSRILAQDNNMNDNLTREDAFHMTVATFLQLRGRPTQPTQAALNTINQTPGISDVYKRNIAIGIDEKFIADANKIRPKDILTYGEMYSILNRLFQLL
ncbi:hypothetical protein EDC18_10943 [Natranaerovirga pectinivora]|uniref:Fibronectin type-III domain-containing protein n=1 Tax=Natranaerovirga pectinivora TaxID=682400 RepID=A0A4R3MKV4_9FIRM|nr:hypothetical protein [Natranaerovirga pectinivora]TCT13080.1 hypothetical protein EDC18_10943 [Natranaerovirga pectinivora]